MKRRTHLQYEDHAACSTPKRRRALRLTHDKDKVTCKNCLEGNAYAGVMYRMKYEGE